MAGASTASACPAACLCTSIEESSRQALPREQDDYGYQQENLLHKPPFQIFSSIFVYPRQLVGKILSMLIPMELPCGHSLKRLRIAKLGETIGGGGGENQIQKYSRKKKKPPHPGGGTPIVLQYRYFSSAVKGGEKKKDSSQKEGPFFG